MAALCALLAPATAGASVHAHAAAKKKKAKSPVVTSVRPMNVEIGQTLEIRGKYFIRGRYKNTVAFKRDGGKAVFAKAKIGTAKMLRVTVPAKLKNEFKKSGYFYVPTRFRIRILSKKFGKKFTAPSKSPLVALKPGTSPVAVTPPASAGRAPRPRVTAITTASSTPRTPTTTTTSCPTTSRTPSTRRSSRSTAAASPRSWTPAAPTRTSDGVEDGYEYQSARDLNDDEYQSPNAYLPYPGKRPYANPLDKGDADIDHDGDSLTLWEEQKLWEYTYAEPGKHRGLDELYYSDGTKYSIYTPQSAPTAAACRRCASAGYDKQVDFQNWLASSGYQFVTLPENGENYEIYDANRDHDVSTTTAAGLPPLGALLPRHQRVDGWLSDDERDEDADGLSNYVESHGTHERRVLVGPAYTREKPFSRSSTPAPTSPTATPTATASATAPTTRTTTTSRT